ncbi:MAG: hypothetical protein HQL13_04710 [Candidatus Omnitrophica bacterium]|nr:hypothetical protein [Candidatus Omnitrophota bacterium]
MVLFLLLVFPVLMAIVTFLTKEARTRTVILLVTAFVHLVTMLGVSSHRAWVNDLLWPKSMPFLGFDAISQMVLTIISVLFFLVSIYLAGYLKTQQRPDRVLMTCLLCLLSAISLVTLSRHMGLLWIAIEVTTLLGAPLISYQKTPYSIEATWKYLLISSMGVGLSLLGTIFLALSVTTGIKSVFFSGSFESCAASVLVVAKTEHYLSYCRLWH